MANKRIVAEVPEDFFWEMKAKAAELKLTQRDLAIIAIRQTMQSEFPLEQLFENQETVLRIKQLGLGEEEE